MRPTIGRWHTRYRVAGEDGGGAVRIENGVRGRVAESYAAALEEVFGDDPAVYVLRRVQTELTLVNPSMAGEPEIARAWGHRACAEVVRTVMRHGDDPSLVMRFDDTAAFVAQWIADLLDGVAWDRWYYGAFRAYRGLSVEEAIRRALIDYRIHVAAILRRVNPTLLLSRVSPVAAREIWQEAVRGETREIVTGEQFRLFVRTAFGIADALDAWIVERPVLDEVLAAYLATSPSTPDWKQPRALAEAVFAVLAFLERRAFLRIVSFSAPALASLEWLDVEWLAASLEAWAAGTSPEMIASRPPALTALQQRILDVVRSLLGTLVLPDGFAFSERNALALYAALAAAEPLLAAHAAAAPLIEIMLKDVSCGAAAASAAETVPGGRSGRRSTSTQTITSAYAGIFLLTRAILEARVAKLAEALGLHVPSLLVKLASEWTCDPEDLGVVFWSGAVDCGGEAAAFESGGDAAALQREVLRFMRDRAAFAPSLEPEDDASISTCLIRLWTHWLPRLGHSSEEWVLRQFILRRGVIRVNEGAIEVALAPAPLDVVLEMAGYLAPIAEVPWLGDRRVAFIIDRSLA